VEVVNCCFVLSSFSVVDFRGSSNGPFQLRLLLQSISEFPFSKKEIFPLTMSMGPGIKTLSYPPRWLLLFFFTDDSVTFKVPPECLSGSLGQLKIPRFRTWKAGCQKRFIICPPDTLASTVSFTLLIKKNFSFCTAL